MDENLESMIDVLEILCESACDAYEPQKCWPGIEKQINDIREYLKDKNITNANRKCVGVTHFMNCDCW